MFVSKSGMENGAVESYNLRKHIEAVKYCRTVTKHDMKFNSGTPSMEINPQSFVSELGSFFSFVYLLRNFQL